MTFRNVKLDLLANVFNIKSPHHQVAKIYTVITRKLWNIKTTLYQYLSVFDVVANQTVLEELIKSLIK